ncbi:MAG: cobalamin-dependent protein [Oligoflexia bacterium]|nr:cobalamin-dependent protein [Oligoflexia bacterium]
MLDCLFLHPVVSPKPNLNFFSIIPMGVWGLAEFLRVDGFSVEIINIGIEREIDNNFSIKKILEELKPKCVAIDMHWYYLMHETVKLSKEIKNNSQAVVVVGGITASIFAKDIIEKFSDSIDFVICGDGFFALRSLVRTIVNKKVKMLMILFPMKIIE